MSIGFKIKKLREQRNVSQNLLANELNISQSELSKIESNQIRKIDFLLIHKVCNYFNKSFIFFIETNKKKDKKEKLEKSLNSLDTTNFFPEKIIDDIKKLIEDNRQKGELIKTLLENKEYLERNNQKNDQDY
jgi:transcriptional regulator with XRE-family HTH domain